MSVWLVKLERFVRAKKLILRLVCSGKISGHISAFLEKYDFLI